MKEINITILILAIASLCFSQGANEKRLEEGNKLAESSPETAIAIFKEVMHSEADTTVTYARAFFNIAVVYSMLGEIDSTTMWYNKILASNLNDKQPGTGFFETYACYHHNAAMQLAIFLFHHGRIEEALTYFQKAYYDYPYDSASGTTMGKRINTIEIWMARCLANLNQIEQAINVLLNGACDCYTPMSQDLEQGIHELAELNGGHEKLIKDVDKGLKKLKLVGPDDNEFVGKTNVWKFSLYGQEIFVCIKGEDGSKEEIISNVKGSGWYNKKEVRNTFLTW